jgi:DNA-binding Lrp family transcriptional regulator
MIPITKLSERQRKILRVAEAHLKDGPEAIARVVKERASSVTYDLRKLEELGILIPIQLFNEMAFGYYLFHVHLQVKPKDTKPLLSALAESSRITYLGLNGGSRVIAATILSKRPEDVFATIDKASAQSKVPFTQVAWCVEGTLYHFGSKFLAPNVLRGRVVTQSWSGPLLNVTRLDAQIIRLYRVEPGVTISTAARRLKVPASTIHYRLSRLEKIGVIIPISGCVLSEKIGCVAYELLIRTSSPSSTDHANLLAFCSAHPSISLLIRCFGDWEYKLVLIVENAVDVFEVDEELQLSFSHCIQSTEIIPRRRVVKGGDFPVEDFEQVEGSSFTE